MTVEDHDQQPPEDGAQQTPELDDVMCAIYEVDDPEELLPQALTLARCMGLVQLSWEQFLSLPPVFRESLAMACEIVRGKAAHPDEVCGMLATGVGDPDEERKRTTP